MGAFTDQTAKDCMTATEVRALVDDEIRAATRVAGEPVIWDPAYGPFLLAEPERQPSGLWLVFGPAKPISM